jgi:hypothetical protein
MGRQAEDFRPFLWKHVNAARQAAAIPVLISSATDIPVVDTVGIVYEHLPLASDIYEATREAPEVVALYLLRRLELIFDKWLITDCSWLGQEAEELVSLRASRLDLARGRVRLSHLG